MQKLRPAYHLSNPKRGSVWQPFLLWILGAPLGVVVLVWFFFFAGR